ncbi:OstA-like protein [Seonamhaeicola sp. NFXS20]|uniref:OstA-like protein n=1 Tax=Seonamhaeicola sp. NFXS20 TaxID=2816959 RepID=UPI003BA33466
MNKTQLKYFFYFICFFSVINGYAQEKKEVQIKYSGFLTTDEENYPGARILTRDDSQQVHIAHESIDLWCDRAIHYGKENFIEAYGNVKMKQADTVSMTSKYIEYSGITQLALARGEVVLKDPQTTVSSDTIYFDRLKQEAFYRSGGTVVKDTTVTITSKIGRHYMQENKFKFVENVVLVNDSSTIKSNYFDYYSDTGHAYLFGPSTITTPESKTYCEKGFYDTENEIGYALKNARIEYNNRIIEGDSLYMDNNKNFASASNNIKVTDTLNHSIIKGHYAEVYKSEEKDSVFITKRALAITVQENDSVYMHADKIMVTGKPENRIIRAYYNARIYKSDLSGKADSIHSNQKTGLTKLINLNKFSSSDKFAVTKKPILWNLENQMTGDTIHLISNPDSEKIDSLLVFENAFIISKDTISKTGFNQIYGMRLKGLFNDQNKLRQVDITQNAESIFYARNDKQELIGIDKAKSGSISILFDEEGIEEYTRINQIDGTLTPESQFLEKDKLLRGFDWREEERINSVEDLFKDDPPLDLPIIKGLEDYVPQDAFFDEDMLERINQAGKHASESIILSEKNDINGIKLKNLLKSSKNLESNDWKKTNLRVEKVVSNSPSLTKVNKLIPSVEKNGYLYQGVANSKSQIKFSITAKGNGKITIFIRDNENGKTKVHHNHIDLTQSWKTFSVSCTKSSIENDITVVIGGIDKNENVFIKKTDLIEVLKE